MLLCEASYLSGPDPMPDMHLTARQAAEHAARAGAGQLVLTHLVPWNDQERTLAEACEFSSFGGADLARRARPHHRRGLRSGLQLAQAGADSFTRATA